MGGPPRLLTWPSQGPRQQFDLRGPLPASSPIVIVAGRSLLDELLRGAPLALAVAPGAHAKFLDIVSRGGPGRHRARYLFAEPSGRGESDDAALAAGIARAGTSCWRPRSTVVREPAIDKEDLNPPIPVVREGAAGCGIANFEHRRRQVPPRATLLRHFQQGEIPSFALLVARSREGGIRGPDSAHLPFLIDFRGGPRTFRPIPSTRHGRGPPRDLRRQDRAGGRHFSRAARLFPTPFAPTGEMPGVRFTPMSWRLCSWDPDRASTRGPRGADDFAGALPSGAGSTRRPFWAFAVVSGAGWPISASPTSPSWDGATGSGGIGPRPRGGYRGAAMQTSSTSSGRSADSRASSRPRWCARSCAATTRATRCSRAGGA